VRFLGLVAVLAALQWASLPTLAASGLLSSADAAGQSCPCCDDVALTTGNVVCVACYVGLEGNGAPHYAVNWRSLSWLVPLNAGLAGVEPQPAEPPPRPAVV